VTASAIVPIVINLHEIASKPPKDILSVVKLVYESFVENINHYFPDIRSPENLLPVLLDPRLKGFWTCNFNYSECTGTG